jgi:hypothetical protein
MRRIALRVPAAPADALAPACGPQDDVLRPAVAHHNRITEGTVARRCTMLVKLKVGSILVALVCFAVAPSAVAVTTEVAKKCDVLTAKAYPPRVVGNPAAGSVKGTGQSERSYFKKCVAKGGNMDGHSFKGAK